MTTRTLACLSCVLLVGSACGTGALDETSVPAAGREASALHPLDPLNAGEIRAAVAAARSDPRLADAAFPSIDLQPPPKAAVMAWRPGLPLAREARLVALTKTSTYETVVDLGGQRLVSVTERGGVEPAITYSEIEATQKVLMDAAFKAALERRGTDLDKVFCAPFSAGYYGSAADGTRLVKIGCFDTRRTTTNLFGWPIEGLYALYDLRRQAIVRISDTGVIPVAGGNQNFDAASIGAPREPRKPTLLAQPEGANFTISGHEVRWGQWRFHVRVDPRVGTVISTASWQDGDSVRSVLYEGYLSEMFVPYMDPDYGWQSRTYFDTGEYGAGMQASVLKAGVDCPAAAAFLPADFGNDKGEPFTTPNALCIFERSGGDPIWRHYESFNQTYEGRGNVELVVRMATTIGNYDYLFDWVFSDAAEIEVRVGATGIDALKGVASRTMADSTAAADTRYGTLLAPNLLGVNHDHYFNFRLDLDVDGIANSFLKEVLTPQSLPRESARRSIYTVARSIPATESAATPDPHAGPLRMRVINETRSNPVGNPVSYELLATNHARLLLAADDWPAKRARFLEHDVWVTPLSPDERYAGGSYVLASRGDDGLSAWSARDRPIRNRDIVVWVNIGMHHIPRAEDLPVMPSIWHSFRLRPYNFFARNPALDLAGDAAGN
jgi:primary-amine oxidase